jgi:hypothetical protein
MCHQFAEIISPTEPCADGETSLYKLLSDENELFVMNGYWYAKRVFSYWTESEYYLIMYGELENTGEYKEVGCILGFSAM